MMASDNTREDVLNDRFCIEEYENTKVDLSFEE
jgi:hypothetical protein